VQSTVLKDKRVLVIVNSLAQHGSSKIRWLYKFIESAGVETAVRLLAPYYHSIYVLRDQEATCAKFLYTLNELSVNPSIRAIDLFLQLHGQPGQLHFYDYRVSTRRLQEKIKRVASRDVLRLVYNTSCYGDTHSVHLLKAGFKVAIGSRRVNASAASEFPIFCCNWPGIGLSRKKVHTVKELIDKADLPGPRRISDKLASRYFKDVDSKKVVRGDGSVTINSIP